MSGLLLLSFVAGVLTVAAPCVLPLLPVIVGGSIVRTDTDAAVAERQWYRPVIIAASLAVSVVVFTLLLKATTAFLGIPQFVWQVIAGGILVIFGLTLVFPRLWEHVMAATGLQNRANAALDRSHRRGGVADRFGHQHPPLRPPDEVPVAAAGAVDTYQHRGVR